MTKVSAPTLAPLAPACVAALTEGCKSIYLAARYEQVRDMIEAVVHLAPAGLIECVYRTHGEERIIATTGGETHLLAGTWAHRGHTADVLLLDDVPANVAEDAMPCLAGGKKPARVCSVIRA